MKQAPILSALAAATLLFSASCNNKSGSSGMMIPKNAAFVVHIDNESLSSKLTWKEIQATEWFKQMSSEADDSMAKKLLADPASAGINTKEDLVFFVQKRGATGVAVFEGSVSDAGSFEKFNHHMLKQRGEGGKTEKDGDMQFIKMGDNAVATWEGDKFTYVVEANMFDAANRISYDDDGNQKPRKKFGPDSLKEVAKGLNDLDSDESLSDDERFAGLLKEDGDVHLWMNSEEYYNALSGSMMSVMSMMKLSTLFKDNISATTLSFDNGQITVKSKQYMSDEMENLMKKHSSKDVNTALINRIPSQNVIGVMACNYPAEGVKDMFKMIGVDGMVNSFLGRSGLSMDDFIKAFNGDMLISVSDLTMKKETETFPGMDYSYTRTKPDMKVLFALSVKDKPTFDRLIGMATEDFKDDPSFNKEVSYKVGNEWFAAGNDAAYVDKFLAGGNSNVAFASKISGHPFGMYVDIQKILASAKSAGDENAAGIDESMKMWQDVVITGGDFKDGYMTSEMVINMVDKKTNALKQLNSYADKMAAAMKKNRHREMEDMPAIDTAIVPPPPAVH